MLAKGDLKFEYGVPWEDIKWYVTTEEKVDFKKKPGVVIEPLGKRQDLGVLLERGELDALFFPHPPHSVMSGKTKARRLFRDTRAEELRYFKKNGYLPDHACAGDQRRSGRARTVAAESHGAMLRAGQGARGELFRGSRLVAACLGPALFRGRAEACSAPIHGRSESKANYKNLERFIEYSHDQNLIESRIPVESLFPEQVLDT